MAIKLEENRKYRMTSQDKSIAAIEFVVLTIDRENNELYIKMTSPISSHDGLVLSSVENSQNEIKEIEV